MLEHRFDPPHVVVERQAADLHLHQRVAGVEMAAHLVLQVLEVWPGQYQPPPT